MSVVSVYLDKNTVFGTHDIQTSPFIVRTINLPSDIVQRVANDHDVTMETTQ